MLPPILTADRKAQLGALIQAGHRPDATPRAVAVGKRAEAEYIEGNLRLVYSVANRYRNIAAMELDDLIQEGTLGLMHAVQKFDWDRGIKFSTYAQPWIQAYITRAIANKSRTIRLPIHIDDEVLKLARTRSLLENKLGRTATDEEVAAVMKVSPAHVHRLDLYNEAPLSLSVPDGDDDGFLEVADPTAEDEFETTELAPETVDLLARLTPKERAVIEMGYGLGDSPQMTNDEIGQVLNITAGAVRRRQSTARRRLRDAVAA